MTADRRVLVVGAGSTAGKLTDALLAIAVRDVVTTISARPLAELLPEDAAPPPHAPASHLALLDCGVQARLCAEPAGSVDRRRSSPGVGCPRRRRLRDLSAAAEAAQRGEMPDRPALVGGQHTLHDHTQAPEGKHTLYSAKPPSIPAARFRAWGAAQPRAPESWARETASAGAPRNGSPWPNSSVPASTAARIGNDCRVRAGSPLRASGISRGPRAWVSTL